MNFCQKVRNRYENLSDHVSNEHLDYYYLIIASDSEIERFLGRVVQMPASHWQLAHIFFTGTNFLAGEAKE